ncbi:MAG TPA: BatD family protein [Flavitalea sp.]|nr:BatD family protein [Flavitalea sp.]
MMQFDKINFKAIIQRLIVIIGLAFPVLQTSGQSELKFVAIVSEKNVALKQPFQVQFVVYGAKYVPDIKVPAIKGFVVNDTFTNQSTQVIGGKTLQWIDSYSKVLVLTPMKTGRFTIPAASVMIKGQKLQTKPIQVSVSQTGLSSVPADEDVRNQPVVQDESELLPGENMEEKVKKNLFLKANTNKTTCYVGEPLAVSYKAYSRLNSNSQVVKRPSFPGFSVVEMVESYDNRPEIEVINGNAFYTNLIRKVQLFPLQPGKYELDPAEIEGVIHFIKTDHPKNDGKSQLQRLFDQSSGSRSNVDHYASLKTAPVTINVKPLPEKDQPADFSGAVGQFKLETKLPAEEIHQGELVKISWQLAGSGNLQLVTLPDIEWPKGIDTSEPSVKEDVNQYVYPLSGTKTFDYGVTARDTGQYVIPPVSFSYFDPQTESYKTLVTEPISFHVAPSARKPFFATETVKNLADKPLHLYWFGGVALVIIGWIAYQFLFLKKNHEESDKLPDASLKQQGIDPEEYRGTSNSTLPGKQSGNSPRNYSGTNRDSYSDTQSGKTLVKQSGAGARSDKPSKEQSEKSGVVISSGKIIPAKEMFTNAQKSLLNDDIKGFYREVQQVLWKIAANRCEVLPSFLNKQNISFQLQKQEIPAPVINNFLTVLNECEWALYTPDHTPSDMEELMENAVAVSEELNKG